MEGQVDFLKSELDSALKQIQELEKKKDESHGSTWISDSNHERYYAITDAHGKCQVEDLEAKVQRLHAQLYEAQKESTPKEE